MIPVDQEFSHDENNGVWGDCMRAVIASLLDLPRNEVPHFLHEAKGDRYQFDLLVAKFCQSKGLVYMQCLMEAWSLPADAVVYHEIMGPSPRDPTLFHAVVGRNGEIVHDPHPDKIGLAGDPTDWWYGFLVKA